MASIPIHKYIKNRFILSFAVLQQPFDSKIIDIISISINWLQQK